MSEIQKGYKQSEFGLIPEDWKLCTFKDVLSTFSSGATPYRGIPEYYKGEIRWISSGELNYNIINETIEHISELAVKNTNLKTHSPGTFLMAVTGLEAEGTRGRCAIVGLPSTTNQSCLAINSTVRMTTKYLFWFYRQWSEYLAFKYCQGTKQQSYTAALVKELPICCPKETTEQYAIATSLSDVDALIIALDKKITKKQQIKQGAMQQLLTGEKRLPGFSGEWVEKSFKDVCWFQEGPGLRNWQFTNSGIKVINVTNLENGFLNLSRTDRYISLDEFHKMYEHFEIDENDIVVASSGNSYGKTAKIRKQDLPLLMNTSVIRLKPFRDLDYNFLWIFLNSIDFKSQIDLLITGGAQPNFGPAHLNKLNIFLPLDKSEQTAIAQILTDMDDEISRLEADRNKYEQIKAGMMQQLLTGKIRFCDD